MAVNVNIPAIEKLNLSNYAGWSRDIKFQLAEWDSWCIIKGTKVRPKVKPENASLIRDSEKWSNAALSCIY